jgi:hypothetical protein
MGPEDELCDEDRELLLRYWQLDDELGYEALNYEALGYEASSYEALTYLRKAS